MSRKPRSRYSRGIQTSRVIANSATLTSNELRDGGMALFPVGTQIVRIRMRQDENEKW